MNLLRKKVVAFFLLASCGSGVAHAELLGGVAAGTYGDTTYEEILDVELRTFPAIMRYPYEVVLRNTRVRRMILCRLFDKEGNVLSTGFGKYSNGEHRIFFTDKTPNATARCYYPNVERRIRPSTGPIPLNR